MQKDPSQNAHNSSHPDFHVEFENIKHPNLSKIFKSINSFAKAVKGDRGTIRTYINNSKKKESLYRKQ